MSLISIVMEYSLYREHELGRDKRKKESPSVRNFPLQRVTNAIDLWIFARKWPHMMQGPQLGIICGLLSISLCIVVFSPVAVIIIWGSWLIAILERDIIGLAVIMAGTALLLSFYAIMLWWRTRWQSSSSLQGSHF